MIDHRWTIIDHREFDYLRVLTHSRTVSVLKTALLDRHIALGARMVPFAGWEMPVQYQGLVEEHKAVRSAAGLFDLSHMGELWIKGPEADRALDYALVTQPSKLAVGKAHYSMICAADGSVMDDLIVYRLGETRYLVVANGANADVVSAALRERLDGFGRESQASAVMMIPVPARGYYRRTDGTEAALTVTGDGGNST